jgi:hypothetical protein
MKPKVSELLMKPKVSELLMKPHHRPRSLLRAIDELKLQRSSCFETIIGHSVCVFVFSRQKLVLWCQFNHRAIACVVMDCMATFDLAERSRSGVAGNRAGAAAAAWCKAAKARPAIREARRHSGDIPAAIHALSGRIEPIPDQGGGRDAPCSPPSSSSTNRWNGGARLRFQRNSTRSTPAAASAFSAAVRWPRR